MSRPTAHWRPPLREGVGASRVAMSLGPSHSVLDFLAQRLPAVPREGWRLRLSAGEVLDGQGQPVAPDARCERHGILWYWRTLESPEPEVPFAHTILHQDERLVVADKPHFLSMTPKGRWLQQTLLVRLKRETGIDTLVPVHRLDRETAGVVLFSVRPQDRHAYQSLFRERQVHKVYEAVAPWRPELRFPLERHTRLCERADAFMQMEEVDGPPNARTRVALIERVSEQLAHYRLTPETGRKHQLRAHMNALGLPIVGDRIYPVLRPDDAADEAPDFSQPLQLLARSIGFVDPISGEPRRFESARALG
jgi:tRNA pseudouridine32 synthase / 23S rRNA pseudouridine746 synthase